MPESEDSVKPYSYVRKFESTSTTVQASDMDKDALQAYIKEILGAGQESASAPKPKSKKTNVSQSRGKKTPQ